MRAQILDLALNEPELSPRELAVRFTDTNRNFVSEASVYRLLKTHDLITSPAFVVIKAANEFKEKTTRVGPSRGLRGQAPNRRVTPFYSTLVPQFCSAVDSNLIFDGNVTERRHHIASALTMLPSRSSLELSLRFAAFAASTLMSNWIRSSTVLSLMMPPAWAKFGMSAMVRIGRSCR